MNVDFTTQVQVFGNYKRRIVSAPDLEIQLESSGVSAVSTKDGVRRKIFIPLGMIQSVTYDSKAVEASPDSEAPAKPAKASKK